MLYLAAAKKRLEAIRNLAAGKPKDHVFTMTEWGLMCVGCGKMRIDVPKLCPGDLYDAEPARLLNMKHAALAILKLEVQELLKRLELADSVIEVAVRNSVAGERTYLSEALEKIRRPAH